MDRPLGLRAPVIDDFYRAEGGTDDRVFSFYSAQ
jgi:hypothetical protein